MSQKIKERVEAREAAAEEEMARREKEKGGPYKSGKGSHGSGPGSGSGPGDGISSRFVLDCLHANELGDGMLYAALHKDRFIHNKSSGEWYAWAGHYWERDVVGRSLAAVEAVAERYLKEAHGLVDRINAATKQKKDSEAKGLQALQKKLYGRIKRLRTETGARHCYHYAQTNTQNALYVKGDEFDIKPWLIACQNGIIDLRTGAIRPGRPDDYISMACPVEFRGLDEPAPPWEQALCEIFGNDTELISYVQRFLGYAITGLNIEHVFPVWWGQGRNGKGTIIETISHILGPMAAPIQAEMLLDQWRAKSSVGPSPDIMALRGLRLAFASESDQNRRLSPSRVKWLTGADTLVGRNPYDKYEIQFTPTHTLILLTNEKPNTPADDFALWERLNLVPFRVAFVEREPAAKGEQPADKELPQKLRAEAPGILAWLVRGCLEWQRIGMAPPVAVIEATKQYRREEDLLGDFIDECCVQEPYAQISAASLYGAFAVWFEENISKKVISQKKFGNMMTKRFKRQKRGTYIYYGIALLERS